MAGQPKRRAALAELLLRAREEFGDECPESADEAIIEYLDLCVASGITITQLADQLSKRVGMDIMRGTIAKWASEAQARLGGKWVGTLGRARARGAAALAEGGLELLRNAPADRDEVSRVKAIADQQNWIAERWNREEFGQQKGATVSISIGGMHLASLTQPVAVPNAIPDAEYEVIEQPVAAQLEAG